MKIFLCDLTMSCLVNIKTRVHSGNQEIQHLTNVAEVAFRDVVFWVAVSWLFIWLVDGFAPVGHPL